MGFLKDIQVDLNAEAMTLYNECHDSLLVEAVDLCKDAHAAEDLVMRTFEEFCKNRDKYDPEKGSWLQWLKGIMRNIHHNASRGKAISCMVYMSPEELALVQDSSESETGAIDAVLANSDAEVVRRAINGLSKEMREVILLKYFEDLPIAQIAKILNASEDSIKCRLYYARKILAKRLGKQLGKKPVAIVVALLLSIASAFGAWKAADALGWLERAKDETAEVVEVQQPSEPAAATCETTEPAASESPRSALDLETGKDEPSTKDLTTEKGESKMSIKTAVCACATGVALGVGATEPSEEANIKTEGDVGEFRTWTGEAGDGQWFTAGNWDRGILPLEGDRVVIAPKANTTILVNAAPPHLLSFALGGDSGTAIVQFQNWDTVLTADEVTVKGKGVLQPYSSFTDTQVSNRVAIVCDNFMLEVDALIDASGKGWVAPKSSANGCGPGAGQKNRGGAGYGGWGACGLPVRNSAFGNPYGSLVSPLDPGSGGGQSSGGSVGGAGGGAVMIRASNCIWVDGSIRADGNDSALTCGAGSGGGVYLTCKTFKGTGMITARGGAATGSTAGGGGGGRIAIVYDVEAQAAVSPKPTPVLHVGARRYGAQYGCYPPKERMPTIRDYDHQCGTPGTVYLADDSFYPGAIWSKCSGLFFFGQETGGAYELEDPSFVDEASVNSAKLAQDVWFHDREVSFPNGLTLPKYVHAVFTNCTVNAKSLTVSGGCFDLRGHSTLRVAGDVVAEGTGRLNFEAGPTNGVEAATWNPWGQTVKVGGKLQLSDTAILYPVSHSQNGGSVNFELGRLIVASGAEINGVACGFGYYTELTTFSATSWGPGASGSANVGPAYGGYGGGAGKQNQHVYGDKKHPTLPGTDGGRWGSTAAYVGGWGGGLFHATVANSVVLDGAINMNGRSSYGDNGCGSSGGGVYLSCNTLRGSGSITANGAGGTSWVNYSGSGGGGRIAVYCTSTNSWLGTMTAEAGLNGYTYTSSPTAGTIYVKVRKGMMVILR